MKILKYFAFAVNYVFLSYVVFAINPSYARDIYLNIFSQLY